ncbi:unnamed protein product [Protopolystoma xenopodis]|uniref:Protein YIF1 n=1 Tax=Protopolystoma xenopodis TaxID=117903 RepID=A0A448X7P2_9PLAT|nr:unnamed protein product [Protopolystoma xenopodis]
MSRYASLARLKHYFAVDNSYVARKLMLLLFPYAHSSWALSYDHSGPVPPRSDINALDLYIPSMAFVTYLLMSGIVFGMQNRFSPEYLGLASSQALAWIVVEILLLYFMLYLFRIQISLTYLDLIAYSGYKFVG